MLRKKSAPFSIILKLKALQAIDALHKNEENEVIDHRKKYFYRKKQKMKISALLSFALAAKGKFRDIIMLWHYHTLFQIFNFRLKMANLRQPVKFRNKTSRLKSVLISDFLYRFFRFCTKSVAEVVENWQVTVPHWNKSPLSGYFGLKGVLFRRQ